MAAAEPKNAASEWMRYAFGYLNEFESPPSDMRASLTDDFAFEDRRRGPTFPTGGAALFPRVVESMWETGAGRPRFSLMAILAVRGDRLAALSIETDYGNGMMSATIEITKLDVTLSRLQRIVEFDGDDVDEAIAELDRLHSRSDTN